MDAGVATQHELGQAEVRQLFRVPKLGVIGGCYVTSGTIPLVPTAIASALSGNVLANQQNVGLALGFDMVIVIGVVMVAYLLLQRRASRWAPK